MNRLLTIIALLFIPCFAFGVAIDVDPASSTFNYLEAATTHITSNLQGIGIKLFFALTMLQLVITGYGQITNGEIEASIGKFAKAFIWISFCVWMMTNNTAINFVANTIQYFLDHAIGWAVGPAGLGVKFDVNGIFKIGITTVGDVVSALGNAALFAATTAGQKAGMFSWFSGIAAMTGVGFVGLVYGLTMTFAVIVIVLAACAYIALKVFMVKIEAAVVLAILPLSISFLGLNAMRDQGFAPFKSMLALVYRIVVLGAVVGGMGSVAEGLHTYAVALNDPTSSASLESTTDILETFASMGFGFLMMLFLAHKSDSIATSLANGSASLGSGDMVGAIATAAAAVATGGAAVAGGASAAKSMGDFMKGLSGSGGNIKSAGGAGAGKSPEPAPSRATSASLANGSKGDAPPTRSGGKDASSSAAPVKQSSESTSSSGSNASTATDSGGDSSTTQTSESAATSTSGASGTAPGSTTSTAPIRSADSIPDSTSTSSSTGVPSGTPQRDTGSSLNNSATSSSTGVPLGSPQRDTGSSPNNTATSSSTGVPPGAPQRETGSNLNSTASSSSTGVPQRESNAEAGSDATSTSSIPNTASGTNSGADAIAGIGKEQDVNSAPKRPTNKEASQSHFKEAGKQMDNLAHHMEKEKQATSVSINVNPHD